jgi:hypothetical protein
VHLHPQHSTVVPQEHPEVTAGRHAVHQHALTGPESSHETAVHIRDSKNPTGPTLQVTPANWTALTTFAAR